MVRLRLTRVLRGPNRNRTLRRFADASAAPVDAVEVEQLFRRFWQIWRAQGDCARVQLAGQDEATGGAE